jgi:hypothetical protein
MKIKKEIRCQTCKRKRQPEESMIVLWDEDENRIPIFQSKMICLKCGS